MGTERPVALPGPPRGTGGEATLDEDAREAQPWSRARAPSSVAQVRQQRDRVSLTCKAGRVGEGPDRFK